MKIRSITLSDIRQFTRPVTVGGFAAGLNVLAAPNEAGKSTLFEAIQALFFIPHRSSRIGHLRPEAGGNPEIRAELDLPDGPCTIVKRWGRGAMAEVTLRFDADLVAVTRDKAGNVVSGSLSDAVQSHDVWTFSRHTGAADPNWLLIDTDEDA